MCCSGNGSVCLVCWMFDRFVNCCLVNNSQYVWVWLLFCCWMLLKCLVWVLVLCMVFQKCACCASDSSVHLPSIGFCLCFCMSKVISSFKGLRAGSPVFVLLMLFLCVILHTIWSGLHLYWSRPAQCLLVAHHGYWVPCGSRLNCAGSRRSLEPQRYSVHYPSACGLALALTNQITCCLASRCLQQRLGEGNSEIKPHSPSYGSNGLTALWGLGIVIG